MDGLSGPSVLIFHNKRMQISSSTVLLSLIDKEIGTTSEELPMVRHILEFPIKKPTKIKSELTYFPEIEFTSITKKLYELSQARRVACPNCGLNVDFSNHLEWSGPEHFICAHCSQLVNVKGLSIASDKKEIRHHKS